MGFSTSLFTHIQTLGRRFQVNLAFNWSWDEWKVVFRSISRREGSESHFEGIWSFQFMTSFQWEGWY